MKTLAMTAALVTALGGTGCIISSTDPVVGDADIAWRFQNVDGQVAGGWTQGNSGCGVASVSHVRVTLWDSYDRVVEDRNYDCVDSTGYPRAYVAALAVGRYAYALEAWRVDAPVFYVEGVVDVFADQATAEDATLPVLASAPFTVYYTQNGARTCSGTPSMRFDLYSAGGLLLETTDPTPVACDPVSTGYTYLLDRSTGFSYEVDVFALDRAGLSVNETCRQLVRHTGFPATVNLLAAPQASCAP